MKKFFKLSFITILLLSLFASCVQDDETVFKSIVHSNPKSKYTVKQYIGEINSTHYVLTRNNGIISFTLNNDGTSAENIEKVDTGKYSGIDSAYLIDNKLFGLENLGDLFLEGKKVTGSLNYSCFSDRFIATTDVGDLYEISATSETVTLQDLSISGVSKVISGKYFKAGNKYYEGESLCFTTDKDVVCITNKNSNYYVVANENSVFNIYKTDDFNTVLGTLSGAPEAAVVLSDEFNEDAGKIVYKTDSAIDIFDSSASSNRISQKTNGWATNLYTNTTVINEFVYIDDRLYCLSGNGGILLITNTTATQIFSK